MSRQIRYSCEVLKGLNKQGLLPPDENGYYYVVLGGYGVKNEGGDYYPFTDHLRSMYESSSPFMRRISRGHLRGEAGHPKPWQGMTKPQWLARLREIKQDRWAFHIRSVDLDFDNFRGQRGEKMVATLGWVRPYQETQLGALLKSSLDNPDEDTCFSVRSLTIDTPINQYNCQKDIQEICTWDWVMEPGIQNATKYHSPGLESLDSDTFSVDDVRSTIAYMSDSDAMCGLESNSDVKPLESIIRTYSSMEMVYSKSVLRRW